MRQRYTRRIYTKRDLDRFYSVYKRVYVDYDSYDAGEALVLDTFVNNPTYKGNTFRTRVFKDYMRLRGGKGRVTMSILKEVMVLAYELDLDPAETMMRVHNYGVVVRKNVTPRNEDEFLDVVRAIAKREMDRTPTERIMVAQALELADDRDEL